MTEYKCLLCKGKLHRKGLDKKLQKLRLRCSACGKSYYVKQYEDYEDLSVNIEKPDIKTESEADLIAKTVRAAGLSPVEAQRVLASLRIANTTKQYNRIVDMPDERFKFLAFTDEHIGSKDFRPDIHYHMAETAKAESVDFAVNGGDTLEGMSGRKGHVFELNKIGYSAQMKYFVELWETFEDLTVYSIEAQNSHTGWYNASRSADIGIDVGEEMQGRSKPYKFIGYDEQDIKLANGFKIRLHHPGTGMAYALSYKGQKYINSLSGGKKPHLIIQGHFHKAFYMFYRNIHFFSGGCLQEQTLFMKKKSTEAMLGYWIIDVEFSKKRGVCNIAPKFYPFYE